MAGQSSVARHTVAGLVAPNASVAVLVDYFDDMQDKGVRKKSDAIGHANVQEIEDRLATIYEILTTHTNPKEEGKLLLEISALNARKKEIEGS